MKRLTAALVVMSGVAAGQQLGNGTAVKVPFTAQACDSTGKPDGCVTFTNPALSGTVRVAITTPSLSTTGYVKDGTYVYEFRDPSNSFRCVISSVIQPRNVFREPDAVTIVCFRKEDAEPKEDRNAK